jgi:hypothetical protein
VAVPGAPPGLGVVVTTAAVSLALLPLLRGRLTGWSLAAGSCALLLAGMSGVLDADWLVALDLLAAFAVGSIVLAGGGSFRELLRGAARSRWPRRWPLRILASRSWHACEQGR